MCTSAFLSFSPLFPNLQGHQASISFRFQKAKVLCPPELFKTFLGTTGPGSSLQIVGALILSHLDELELVSEKVSDPPCQTVPYTTSTSEGLQPHPLPTQEDGVLRACWKEQTGLFGFPTRYISIRSDPFCPISVGVIVHPSIIPSKKVSKNHPCAWRMVHLSSIGMEGLVLNFLQALTLPMDSTGCLPCNPL